MFRRLWNDENGAILSMEIILAGTVLAIGVITGLTSLRDGLITELADVGAAVAWLDQSYHLGGVKAHCAVTSGVWHEDLRDFCDDAVTGNEGNSRCLVLCELNGSDGEGNVN